MQQSSLTTAQVYPLGIRMMSNASQWWTTASGILVFLECFNILVTLLVAWVTEIFISPQGFSDNHSIKSNPGGGEHI